MLYANASLINPILRASRIEELKFRVGIDYGSVTIAQIGAAKRFGSLAAIGTTANVACKILDVAGPDEVVLGENVVRRLPPSWRSQWCILKKSDTGWYYQTTGSPYRFFAYIGRWTQPL
jgi:class 3 adenylate cyclase